MVLKETGLIVPLIYRNIINKVEKVDFPSIKLHVYINICIYKYTHTYIPPKCLKPIISEIRRKKTTRIFSLQDMFRIFLYPSSLVILNC